MRPGRAPTICVTAVCESNRARPWFGASDSRVFQAFFNLINCRYSRPIGVRAARTV